MVNILKNNPMDFLKSVWDIPEYRETIYCITE